MSNPETVFPALPIDPILPEIRRALAGSRHAVLQAPPGAGKTTRVPLALLQEGWLAGGKLIMLEPRRLAARAAARRMAGLLGEAVGETVGYRVRMDSKVGPRTRIEVVTEGVLIRQLQQDPALEGVGAVLFDEFHERSLDADLGLALCLQTRSVLRDDLRLLVMSATLDGAAVAGLLGGAPVVTSEGRAFPVETRHVDPSKARRIEDAVASAVLRALDEEPGNILVFLPGVAEIRRVERQLRDALPGPGILIAPLYGDLPQEQQDQAIGPTPPGRRKVVLATSIAETSLTIEGIRVVVDSGLMRVSRFDPGSGMTRLDTVKVSQASADQRRGRAGRLEPGVCYRLWPEGQHRALQPHTAPEMLAADLAPLALELAQWGVVDPAELCWLDPPPAPALAQARDLLRRLGALDAGDKITPHGRRMASLGMHPRLAHMVLAGDRLGCGALACEIAALLGERDILAGPSAGGAGEPRDGDLRRRVELLRSSDRSGWTVKQVARQARQWQRQLGIGPGGGGVADTGRVLALAYPDRIGQRRPGSDGQYRLSNGRGAYFLKMEPLAAEEFLAVADLDGAKREARIFLAAPLTLAELEEDFADTIETVEFVAWDGREEAVLARRQRRLGELVLKDEPLPDPGGARTAAALCQGIRELGLAVLPWTRELENFRARVEFLRRVEGPDGDWPDLSDAALLDTLEDWLAPFLTGLTRRAHLKRLDLSAALRSLLSWHRQRELDEAAPTHVTVPSGSHIPLDYTGGDVPVLAVRLQEMFGLAETPALARGRVPLVLHLLSPARRPMQVTSDLASFWANTYRHVKADLKGQYPKHYWPDDPLQAEPTSRAKRRGT
ncbi:ATP-dependent helicase HrpB [Skermanella mucosa]|uniref:ATP-dependent helicase HrpB n=1 Tax=Skermanella mucosa TaxID=1789672 RepID=UPI00192C8685|nr:ATP-dependent helicase HrpB [Skermanella mucosa]UEM22995.1 ATP-dependent helicase HrpB [Skermanella mucosa]